MLELLSRLRHQGVRLWIDGDQLRFSAPKGVVTAAIRSELREHKAAILSCLRTVPAYGLPEILRRPRNADSPLSFAQQRLWFLDRLSPGSSAYNVPRAMRLLGRLDVSALQRALNEIMRRHEALRTTFASRRGTPFQIFAPPAAVPLELEDLSGLLQPDRENSVRQIAVTSASAPFDLERGPLFRVKLLRLGAREHVLFLTMHHIVSDGWSMGVLFSELGLLYNALLEGAPSPLPNLDVQYADYALWQHDHLTGQVLQELLTFWRGRLEGVPVLELPSDHPRPAVQSHRGAEHTFLLPAGLTQKLEELARQERASLFMVLLAAFQVLMFRYSGQEDFAVGTPIAGRTRMETEGVVGPFVNTLALRADLAGDVTFRQLLAQVRRTTLEAYAHQALPFERLIEELQPDRDLSRNVLFQVMIVHNGVKEELSLTGLAVEQLQVEWGTALFDLGLSVWDDRGDLKAVMEYPTDLFEAATIARLAEHYRILLEGIVVDPETRLSTLPLLNEKERIRLILERNPAPDAAPERRCLHDLFEEQVHRTPAAEAVRCGGGMLTYTELNRRATQLARDLKKSGIKPEARVGIYLSPGIDMIVAILAVLKAGNAYVPLDPQYPTSRLDNMLQDADAQMLLTDARLLAQLPTFAGKVVCLDEKAADVQETARRIRDRARNNRTVATARVASDRALPPAENS